MPSIYIVLCIFYTAAFAIVLPSQSTPSLPQTNGPGAPSTHHHTPGEIHLELRPSSDESGLNASAEDQNFRSRLPARYGRIAGRSIDKGQGRINRRAWVPPREFPKSARALGAAFVAKIKSFVRAMKPKRFKGHILTSEVDGAVRLAPLKGKVSQVIEGTGGPRQRIADDVRSTTSGVGNELLEKIGDQVAGHALDRIKKTGFKGFLQRTGTGNVGKAAGGVTVIGGTGGAVALAEESKPEIVTSPPESVGLKLGLGDVLEHPVMQDNDVAPERFSSEPSNTVVESEMEAPRDSLQRPPWDHPSVPTVDDIVRPTTEASSVVDSDFGRSSAKPFDDTWTPDNEDSYDYGGYAEDLQRSGVHDDSMSWRDLTPEDPVQEYRHSTAGRTGIPTRANLIHSWISTETPKLRVGASCPTLDLFLDSLNSALALMDLPRAASILPHLK